MILAVWLSVWCMMACVRLATSEGSSSPTRRIAFGSCHTQLRESIFDTIGSFDPDQLVLLGDNIYADTKVGVNFLEATPEQLSRHYCALNGDPSWQRLVRRLGGYGSILATWDDHDYGINNGDSTYQYKNESMESFLDFFRIPSDSPRRDRDGVYHSTVHEILDEQGRAYQYKIITLDTRYNMLSVVNGASEPDMLGPRQWAWLTDELTDLEVDFILLGSGVQVLPSDKLILESWHYHDPKGRERLLSLISLSPCPNIILLSGDVHEAEISQATCMNGSRKLYELTSSGLTHGFAHRTSFVDTAELVNRGCDKDLNLHLFESNYATTDKSYDLNAPVPPVDVEIRGFIYTYAHALFQATFPSHYREQRFGHHYGNINFGLLDIYVDSAEEEHGRIGRIHFSAINHEGDEVIGYDIPLKVRVDCTGEGPGNGTCLNTNPDAGVISAGDSVCVPYWGPVPKYKEYLLQFCLVSPLIVFGVLPALYIVWLLCASVYYIFWVSELKRRERLEEDWQRIKATK